MGWVRLIVSLVLTVYIGQQLPLTLHSQLLYWFVTIPGTAMHEAAHWLTALVLQGNPGVFSLIPEYSNGQMTSMGHATFSPTWYNAASVGLAPYLLYFPSAWFVVKSAKGSLLWGVVFCYVAACGFASVTPSPADWSIAVSQPLSFLFAAPFFIAVAGTYYVLIMRRLKAL